MVDAVFFCICIWQELVVALSHLVVQYESNFCTVALQFIEEEKNYSVPSPANTAGMWSAVPLIRVTVSDFKHVGFVHA